MRRTTSSTNTQAIPPSTNISPSNPTAPTTTSAATPVITNSSTTPIQQPTTAPSTVPLPPPSTTPTLTTPTSINNQPITYADMLNITNSSKCAFPTYTKTQNIYEWQTTCILELATSNKPIHKNMLQYDSFGDPILKSVLPKAENQELFRMTKSALSTKLNTRFITVDMIRRADGLHLWNELTHRFKPLNKDAIELSDMQANFTTFSKFPNETDDMYVTRFEETVQQMEYFHIKPSQHLQVIVFLSGLKDSRLQDPIMQLRQSPQLVYKNWIQPDNITHTLQKARAYCALINQYAPREPSNIHQPTTTPPPNTSMNATNINQLKAQFKAELLASSDVVQLQFQI